MAPEPSMEPEPERVGEEHVGDVSRRLRYDDEFDDLGGDPVCWVQYVCPRCGSIVEGVDHDLTCRPR